MDSKGIFFKFLLTFFFILGIAPFITLLSVAFTDLSSFSEIGLILKPERSLDVAFSSLVLSTLTLSFSIAIGISLAALVTFTDVRFKGLIWMGSVALAVTPSFMLAIAWNAIGAYFSVALDPLIPQFLEGSNIFPLLGSLTVLVGITMPFVMVMTVSSMSSIDRSLIESSLVGKGMIKTFSGVIIPLSKPGILMGACLAFIRSISDFGAVSIFGYDTLITEVYYTLGAFNDIGAAAFISLIALIPSVLLISLLIWAWMSNAHPTSVGNVKPVIFRLEKYRSIASIYCIFLVILLIGLPSFWICVESVYQFGNISFFSNYTSAISFAYPNLRNSIIYSIIGTVACMSIGASFAYLSSELDGLGRAIIHLILLMPLIVPGTILGLGMVLIWNFNSSPFYNSWLMVLMVFSVKFSIVGFMAFFLAQSKISRNLNDLGKISPQHGLNVYLFTKMPMMVDVLLPSMLLIFALCMGELDASIVVYPPGAATLPVSIYIISHDGPPGIVAALCVILLAITYMPLIAYYILTRFVKWRYS